MTQAGGAQGGANDATVSAVNGPPRDARTTLRKAAAAVAHCHLQVALAQDAVGRAAEVRATALAQLDAKAVAAEEVLEVEALRLAEAEAFYATAKAAYEATVDLTPEQLRARVAELEAQLREGDG